MVAVAVGIDVLLSKGRSNLDAIFLGGYIRVSLSQRRMEVVSTLQK